jgi:flagellar biosynthesis protein FlhF
MYVKRVYAPTVREALASAREQLGDGALVLSTELVPAPGWRGWTGQRVVRLTAAAERGIEADADVPAVVSGVSADRPAVPADRPVSAPRPVLSRRPVTDRRAGVVARLVASGLDMSLAQATANRMTDAECRGGSDQALRRALVAELEAASGVDEKYAHFEVFVGPPGVGKTTTIAKIAAQECARRGTPLNLIAADAFRAGAIEQLRSYAEIMGSPLRIARSADEFADALSGSRQTALVDTAGRSPKDTELSSLFDVLRNKRGVRTHLVLAADTSAASARRLLDAYAPLQPARVVITKLDESESMMPLFDAVRERGLPVSYLTAGQRVPEDLWRATPASLAAAILRESPMEGMTCH